MKRFILILTILLTSTRCYAKHLYTEKEYQTYWCNARGGVMEYVLPDKARVDCLLPDMAVEFDFARKQAECLGQAQQYSAVTKKTPVCVLIVESERDYKHVNRLRYTIQKKKLDVRVFTIKPTTLMKAGIMPKGIE